MMVEVIVEGSSARPEAQGAGGYKTYKHLYKTVVVIPIRDSKHPPIRARHVILVFIHRDGSSQSPRAPVTILDRIKA